MGCLAGTGCTNALLLRPKKVGTLKRPGSDDEKRTNEIGMAIPLLEECDISEKTPPPMHCSPSVL